MKRPINPLILTYILLYAICPAARALETKTINDGWTFRYYTDSVDTPVHLPHSWNTDAYDTRQYRRGTGIYKRILDATPRHTNGSVYIKLDGAASKSSILIDGKEAGSHIGGYSPHIADITPLLTPGATHEITVVVDNTDREIPPYSADFTFMGGLYRDAWLITTPPVHFDITTGPISGIKALPTVSANGTCCVDVSGKIVNTEDKKRQVTVKATLYAPDGKTIGQGSKKLTLQGHSTGTNFDIKLSPLNDISLWRPETPTLYTLETTIESDGQAIETTSTHVGFRTFAFDDEGRFLLNGAPYKLRGMCRHQDQKPMGIALTDEQHRRDMRMIKDMGANFIRISHYPQDDAILEMCDRLGLIAWEEIPVIDYVPDSEQFADNSETMLREMIRCHYNHPSIAMWGYMNEILLRMPTQNQDDTKLRTLQLAQRLERATREEDPYRMTTMAFHGSDVYHPTGIAGITDVKGWNLYQGWYGGKFDGFEEFLSRQHREHPAHKLIVSEYGAGSDRRIHSLAPEAFDFSIEYQQDYLEHYLPVIEDSTFVAGASHWNFIDFSSANRAESMPHINNKGLVTNDRRKKDVYYYYRAAWTDTTTDTVAHIAVRDWLQRTEIIDESGFKTFPVKVYTNLPEVSMTVNGIHLGTKKVQNHNAIFDVDMTEGNNIITIAPANQTETTLDAAVVELTAIKSHNGKIDLSTTELAINAGSNCYFRSDESALTWLPDKEYSPGSLYGHIGGKRSVSQDEISLTADAPLLQRGISGVEKYVIDVTPGLYEVELSFADPSSPSALSAYMLGHNAGNGNTTPANMNIDINGQRVETHFSPGRLSGVKSMVKRRYIANVTDQSPLTVTFTPTDGGITLLSAIKIRKF